MPAQCPIILWTSDRYNTITRYTAEETQLFGSLVIIMFKSLSLLEVVLYRCNINLSFSQSRR